MATSSNAPCLPSGYIWLQVSDTTDCKAWTAIGARIESVRRTEGHYIAALASARHISPNIPSHTVADPGFMARECSDSCGLCSTVCMDHPESCGGWAADKRNSLRNAS